jgi:hypothetical protein
MRRYLIDYAGGRTSAEFMALEGFEDILPADRERTDRAVTVDRLLNELSDAKPEWSGRIWASPIAGRVPGTRRRRRSAGGFCLPKKTYWKIRAMV